MCIRDRPYEFEEDQELSNHFNKIKIENKQEKNINNSLLNDIS